jgi:enoyl-CoA hydratase/carnithine racemase
MDTANPIASVEPLLLRQDQDGICTLTLNRPQQFNALSEALLAALQSALDTIAADRGVRVVILAGAGKAFCSGHDLKEMMASRGADYFQALFRQCARMMLTISQMPQPVIARVHGVATAAGCQLVAQCDLAVAAEGARFATSGINLGLFCATPSVPLARNVGRKTAFEMLFTGDFISAARAREIGLVNQVVALPELDQAVLGLARAISGKTPVAVAAGKRMFYQQLEQGIAAAYDHAAQVMACNMMSEDTAEGINAFFEKRPPRYQGC